MNKQPFYHRIEILFTATQDLSYKVSCPAFEKAVERFLKRQFPRTIVTGSVQHDGAPSAEPGDPADLVG